MEDQTRKGVRRTATKMRKAVVCLVALVVAASIVATVIIKSPSRMEYLKAQEVAAKLELKYYIDLWNRGIKSFWYSEAGGWKTKMIGWGYLVPVYTEGRRIFVDVNERIKFWNNQVASLKRMISVLEQIMPCLYYQIW